jgi:hypothetical protein
LKNKKFHKKEEVTLMKPNKDRNKNKKKGRKEDIKDNKLPKEKLPIRDPQEEVSLRMKNLFGEETLKSHKLPQSRAEKPYVISSKTGEIMIINSPLIGSLVSNEDKTDIVKNALRLANVAGHDAVIITGNVIYMLAQRYGAQRSYKTQVSGIKVNSKKIESEYPKSVTKDKRFQSTEERFKKGEPVFMTLKSRLEHNVDLLHDVFTDNNNKPLYDGSVYVIFGKLEDELIMFYANEFLRVGLFKSRAWAQKKVMKYVSAWRKEKDSRKKSRIYQKVKDWKEWLSIFAVMGNITDESLAKAREIATGYIIKKYEERIPNAKVISIGDAFIKTDSRTLMVTTDKNREVLNGNLSSKLAEGTESFSKGRPTKNIPDVMLGMGMNPFLDVKWATYQASEDNADKKTCMIIQLPVCLDSERYRNVIRDQNIVKDKLTKVGQKSGFESGVITLQWHKNVAQPILRFWTSDLLKNKEVFKEKKGIQDLIMGNKKEHESIFAHKLGDTHHGVNDIRVYESPNDPNGYVLKTHRQVAMEFMLNANAPILMEQHDGDIVQGMNHSYAKYVNPKWMLPEQLVNAINKIEHSEVSLAEKFKLLRRLSLHQKIVGGVLQPDDQMRSFVLSTKPYLKYYLNMIERKKKVKLSFKGRISAVMHIIGNHFQNTFKTSDISISDAFHITEQLKKCLLGCLLTLKKCILTEKDIEEEFTAPQHSYLGEGRGSFGIEGCQRYALILKHKQGDNVRTQKRAQRRGINGIEVGLPIINLSGDNHKGGIRVTRGIVNIKTGSQVGEGAFGREIDGSEQNILSIVYGVPVGGFACGPISFVILDEKTMRDFAAKPFKIDGKKLFRNAIE